MVGGEDEEAGKYRVAVVGRAEGGDDDGARGTDRAPAGGGCGCGRQGGVATGTGRRTGVEEITEVGEVEV